MFSSISEKDKKILFVFTIFVVGIFYYFLIFQNQINLISDLKNKNSSLKERRDFLQMEIIKYNKDKANIENVKYNYIDISKKIPNNQDEKFSLLDAKKLSQLVGTSLGEVTISEKKNLEIQLPNKKKINKAYIYNLNLNWVLTYDNFKKLISNYINYDVIYSVDNISIIPMSDGKINVAFDMKFYGFDDKNAPVREWKQININSGKENIFASGSEQIGQSSLKPIENDIDTIDKNKDFLILLSTLNSPTSAITVEKSGKGIDIFGSNKAIENVDINVTGKNGKYFYSMSTEGEKYPQNGQTSEFKPNSDNIIILVYSQNRKYEGDKNKAIINVHNKSDKKVYVYIINEDTKFPRGTITKDGSSIFVYSK